MTEQFKDGLGSTCYRIQIEDSTLIINVTRGGIPISYQCKDRELFYNDVERYQNINTPIWGGIPILFPSVGKVEQDLYVEKGAEYPMPMHGIIRNMHWELHKEFQDGASFMIRSDEESLRYFPYHFTLIFRYILNENALEIYQSVINEDDTEFAFALGLHPYFLVGNREDVQIHMQGQLCENYLTGEKFSYPSEGLPKFEGKEFCYIVEDGSRGEMRILEADCKDYHLQMQYSTEYPYIVLWSAGEDFICIEPWTSKPNALNTRQELVQIKPKEEKTFVLKLKIK